MYILFFLISLTSLGCAQQRSSDPIHATMDTLFAEHISQKKMTPELIQRSMILLITQFDPNRVYLLQEEVASYMHCPNWQLEEVAAQYELNDYSFFKKLNTLFQHAIIRARQTRAAFTSETATYPEILQEQGFAKTLAALAQRQDAFVTEIMQMQHLSLKQVDEQLAQKENEYLYQTADGQPLSTKEQRKLFDLHLLQALTAALDPHSVFMDFAEARSLRLRLEQEYIGVGIALVLRGDAYVITDILPGSSAEKSHQLRVGDELLAVNGTPITGLSIDEVSRILRGKSGREVTLKILQKSNGVAEKKEIVLQQHEIDLTTGRVSTSFRKTSNGIIGVIALDTFYESPEGISSAKDMINALKTLRKQGTLQGLVLDLRNNGGGFVMQAVKVAGLFIKTGVIVMCKYSSGKIEYLRDLDPSVYYSGPFVILVSKVTASAAEIVTQALKDYGVAIVVGAKHTYGKGSIQAQTVMDSQAPFYKVTVGYYYSVSGVSPQCTGVKADIVVPGIHYHEKIGEKYLKEALHTEPIAPDFHDRLQGVPASKKPWYIEYYLPFLQKPTDKWRKFIPELAAMSSKRIADNSEYQTLLREPESAEQEKQLEHEQLEEAMNIVQDLSHLAK